MRPLSSWLPHIVFALGLSTASLLMMPYKAHAQSADEAEAEQDAMNAQKQAEARKAARHAAPPSALPGAETEDEDNSHARVDVNPTAALFDAVNRGSLVGAKEALNRGADINARNVLDQTPLDLAIDLGRNDIMFQLLSLRTYNPDGKLITSSSHESNGEHITINGQAGITAKAPPRIIEDRGQPIPAVGFLGFNGPSAPEPAHPALRPLPVRHVARPATARRVRHVVHPHKSAAAPSASSP